MLPVIAIVGRPNVGKSTFFNKLTGTRDALVSDMPGVTRDRQYGRAAIDDKKCWIVDTGGIAETSDHVVAELTDQQVDVALGEAHYIIFMVDGRAGLTSADESIAQQLRQRYADKVVLAVNKADRESADIISSEFYGLGFPMQAIAAQTGRGIEDLMRLVLQDYQVDEDEVEVLASDATRVAVVGRPNVGKSTLINRIMGEERVMVLDRPGTTRDSIYIPFERRGTQYTLIDTAGVRRKSKVTEAIEKFSIVKTLQAIEQAHVVIVVLDAQQGLSEQDLKLIGYVLHMGRAIVLAFNKWDDLDDYKKSQFKDQVDRKLSFLQFARRYFISALHGTGVGKLYFAIDEAFESASKQIATSVLTRVLTNAIESHQPPLVSGRRIKLRYAHVGEHHPLTFVIHGKQIESLPGSYQRYLANYFRKSFKLVGVPLLLKFINDDNPYG